MRFLTTIAVLVCCAVTHADEFKVTPRNTYTVTERAKSPAAAAEDNKFRLEVWSATWCKFCPQAIAEARAAASDLGIVMEVYDYDDLADLRRTAKINAPPTLCIVSGKGIHERLEGGAKRATLVAKVRDWQKKWGIHQAQMLTASTHQPDVSNFQQNVYMDAPGRYADYGGTRYDMETWSPMCSMRSCNMCRYLNQCQANYFAAKRQMLQTEIPSPQSATPNDVVDEALIVAKLTPEDLVAELGSGDGGPAIRMARETGCRVIGIENDPVKVAKSRENITKAGLDDKIMIIEGDVRDFNPEQYGVTVIYAYLYPELLAEIPHILSAGRITICPGHKPEGIDAKLVGQCWVRESAPKYTVATR